MKTKITNEQIIDLEDTLDEKNPFYPDEKTFDEVINQFNQTAQKNIPPRC